MVPLGTPERSDSASVVSPFWDLSSISFWRSSMVESSFLLPYKSIIQENEKRRKKEINRKR